MKSTTMLVAATAALLAMNATAALSQEACAKGYGSCVNACVAKPIRSLHEPCILACQQKNDECSSQVFGVRRQIDPPQQAAGQGRDALAKERAPAPKQAPVQRRQ